uniref:14-3-3 domain-containing protein n=2 Tax=Palpitomonas bilix TaxID=652834 RepID=A0A7S3DC12_9EUKA|mmetsp:Transcript_31095/g.81619  ORF Transcript_31095/g.81619 Transcript_31095/m.81619 type:complete len:227 (+) Transcript_31095:228-908(+)
MEKLDEVSALIHKAKVAEQAEMHEMVISSVSASLKLGPANSAQRGLLQTAYKNMVGKLRSSWRILLSQEKKHHDEEDEMRERVSNEFRMKVEARIKDVCHRFLDVVESELLPSLAHEADEEEKVREMVRLLKVKGDYLRYLAEITPNAEVDEVAEAAAQAYNAGLQISKAHLTPSSRESLGIVLNFSVFLHDVMNDRDAALKVANEVRTTKSLRLECRPYVIRYLQ